MSSSRLLTPVLVVLLLVATTAAADDATHPAPTAPVTSSLTNVSSGAPDAGGWLDRMLQGFHHVQNWLVIGLVLLVGRLGGKLTARLRSPMVVGYLLVGILLGRSALNLINVDSARTLELVTDFGLGIVAFMIGTELSGNLLRRLGMGLIVIMVAESLGAFVIVGGLIWGLSSWVFPTL